MDGFPDVSDVYVKNREFIVRIVLFVEEQLFVKRKVWLSEY